MSREGRSQPIQPFVPRELLDDVPPPEQSVENIDDRRRRIPPPSPVVISGALASFIAAPVVTPPEAQVVEWLDKLRRPLTPDPIALSGAVAFQTGAALEPQTVVVPLLERARQLPISPEISAGFDDAEVPIPDVVERDDRRRRATPDPVVVSGVLVPQAPVGPAPPAALNVDRADQRVRYLPLDPYVNRTALEVLTGAALTPPQPDLVENEDRRRRFTPDSIVVGGALAALVGPPGATPPPPLVVPIFDERGRRLPQLPPQVSHGFSDPGPGPVGTTPPPTVNVDRVDRRPRPPDPTVLSGSGAVVPAPPGNPPAPFVVPIEERRRFLAQLPPTVKIGYDDVQPPEPNVSEPDDRKRRRPLPPDPTIVSGTLAAPPPAVPPGPYVVPLSERSRLLAALNPPEVKHGPYPPPPVLPPPPFYVDRVDQRVRYKPLDPVVFSGVLTTAPLIPVVTGFFGPPHPSGARFTGSPDDSAFEGGPDDSRLTGQPDDDAFAPPNPQRS